MAAVDWFGASVAAPAPARTPRPRAVRAPARKRASGLRLTGGIVWIAAFAVMLTGVVALNVAVLRLNMNVSKLDKQQVQLQAENAALASEVSRARSARKIEATARKLGLIPAPGTDTSYLDLGSK
jgi:cell division protein FtsL